MGRGGVSGRGQDTEKERKALAQSSMMDDTTTENATNAEMLIQCMHATHNVQMPIPTHTRVSHRSTTAGPAPRAASPPARRPSAASPPALPPPPPPAS